MILYNTLMGVCAGLALILVPVLARKLYRRERVSAEGWSIAFYSVGSILTFLSALMAVTWPLTANPPINIMFAEPSLILGVLLLLAGFFLWKRRDTIAALSDKKQAVSDAAYDDLQRVMRPVSWVLFALGLVLLSCTAAIFRFVLVGSAPEFEPITGLLHNYPGIENGFFGVLYGLSALGCLLAPWAVRNQAGTAARVVFTSLLVAGVCFLLFSAMNYYTHIGMLVNLERGTNYRF